MRHVVRLPTAHAGVQPEGHGAPLAGAAALHAQAGGDAGAALRVQLAAGGQQLPWKGDADIQF